MCVSVSAWLVHQCTRRNEITPAWIYIQSSWLWIDQSKWICRTDYKKWFKKKGGEKHKIQYIAVDREFRITWTISPLKWLLAVILLDNNVFKQQMRENKIRLDNWIFGEIENVLIAITCLLASKWLCRYFYTLSLLIIYTVTVIISHTDSWVHWSWWHFLFWRHLMTSDKNKLWKTKKEKRTVCV